MDHVLGQQLRADEPIGKAVGRPRVAAVERVERVAIALRETSLELDVFEVTLSHRRILPDHYHAAVRRVVLYSRSGCHLCDDARTAILAVRGRHRFAFEEIDIESDDALLKEYAIRIPVVSVDGHERFEITVDEAQLSELVRT